MAFNPYTNDEDKDYSHTKKGFTQNKIPDILSQAESIVNNFITKPPKQKKKSAAFFASMYISFAILALAAFFLVFLK